MAGLALGAATLAGAIALRAQDPPAPTFRTGVDIVHVDVSVLDKNRTPVRGLTAADFTVLEDGKLRPIVAFTAVDLPPPPAEAEPVWAREVAADVATNATPPEGRLIAIIFDWSIRFEDQPAARRFARAIVEDMGPGDLGGVAYSSGAVRAGTAQNFTSDKARLFEAIDRPIAPSPVDPDGEPSPGTDCGLCALCGWEKAEFIADAVAEVPSRRKTMIFLSSKGPGGLEGVTTDCEVPIRTAREIVTRKAGLANLSVHVIDPSLEGLNTQVSSAGIGTLSNASFARHNDTWPVLAEVTDGRLVMDDNEAERFAPAILDETSSYYVLAFESADRGAATGRDHVIEMKVARRDVSVQHRSLYQAGQTPAAREMAARTAPLIKAVDATMPQTGLPLTLALAPFATPGRSTGTVAVTLRVLPLEMAPDVPEGRETVNVVVAALDPARGRAVGSLTQRAEIPARVARTGEYELLSRIDLPPGRYEIRAALETASGVRGSVYGFVEVPDFSGLPLALSGVAWHVSPEQMSAPRNAFADLLPIVPTARRTFSFFDRVTAFVRLYTRTDAARPAHVTTRILDAQGRAVHEEDRDGEADYQFDLPVERLAAGEYLLSIEATAGVNTASRRVPFTVQ
jgi:VWFA-related protein